MAEAMYAHHLIMTSMAGVPHRCLLPAGVSFWTDLGNGICMRVPQRCIAPTRSPACGHIQTGREDEGLPKDRHHHLLFIRRGQRRAGKELGVQSLATAEAAAAVAMTGPSGMWLCIPQCGLTSCPYPPTLPMATFTDPASSLGKELVGELELAVDDATQL
eukprot:TRINITY_DN96500_c0_g1_i1.p2 TRINITY_DN96500_c0_g1~~TRINITY_DN96500_c0_g1_i1.p2  ORF type:complete len:160 (+),score=21.08 TRINITY_DN96500_c0_g1_i1:202-681(+)